MSFVRDDIRAVLTADWIYRKQREWPLIELTPSTPIASPYVLSAEEKDAGVLTPSDRVFKQFELLKTILRRYPNKLALCGGAVASELFENHDVHNFASHRDVDLFFYNVSEREATEILEDCVATIVSSDRDYASVRVEHRELVTNVVIRREKISIHGNVEQHHRVYQFIHRIYPTLDSILGGFDIGLSMFSLSYTNAITSICDPKIHATPLSAFCAQHNVIIIDTTRRSFSYEYRILKYRNRFHSEVYFPGLDELALRRNWDDMKLKDRLDKRITKLERLMSGLGLKFKQEDVTKAVELDPNYVSDESSSEDEDGNRKESGEYSLEFTNMQLRSDEETIVKRIPAYAHRGNWKQIIQGTIKKYSDYSSSKIWDEQIPLANASMLRTKNLQGIMVTQSYEPNDKPSYRAALFDFQLMVNKPEIVYDGAHYESVMYVLIATNGNHQFSLRRSVCLFAEHFQEWREFFKPSQYATFDQRDKLARSFKIETITSKMLKRMKSQAVKAEKLLTGIRWITENPGRQYWTASFNPIMLDPRDFYGDHYVPFHIGIPRNIESTLRLFRLRDTIWKWLPRDLFNLILSYVVRNYMYTYEEGLSISQEQQQAAKFIDSLRIRDE